MKDGTLTIGTFFGIPLKLHWSFALLVIYVLYNVYSENSYLFLWMTMFLFLCVVLHEYGHALMARKYKVKTQDIILSPIGGVARLENIPEKPTQELAIAFAGPLVNLILCIIFGVVFFIFFKEQSILNIEIINTNKVADYVKLAFVINAILFIFNLIPAFPMDGGRVLRALLAIKMGRGKATKIASIVGRIFAIGFMLYGLYYGEYTTALVGFFVFSMAGAESKQVDTAEKLSLSTVEDFMNTEFTSLHIGDPLERPIELYKRKGESNFIVRDSLGYIVGTLPSLFLLDAIKEKKQDIRVGQFLSDKIIYAEKNINLKEAYELLNDHGSGILIIKENDEVIGVIDREALGRAIAVGNVL